MALSKDLLAILACPQCKGKLLHRPENPSLDCGTCRLSYPVRDNIPVLLTGEAKKLPDGE